MSTFLWWYVLLVVLPGGLFFSRWDSNVGTHTCEATFFFIIYVCDHSLCLLRITDLCACNITTRTEKKVLKKKKKSECTASVRDPPARSCSESRPSLWLAFAEIMTLSRRSSASCCCCLLLLGFYDADNRVERVKGGEEIPVYTAFVLLYLGGVKRRSALFSRSN